MAAKKIIHYLPDTLPLAQGDKREHSTSRDIDLSASVRKVRLGSLRPAVHLTLFFLLCSAFPIGGCIQNTVRTDLDTYLNNRDLYAGRNSIITATLGDVLDRYSLYEKKKIEVAAPVLYYRDYGFWTWHLLLEEKGRMLRCYTHYYRVEPGWDAVNLLDRAMSNKNSVTVVGILTKDGIDIQRLSCGNESATASYRPPRALPHLRRR